MNSKDELELPNIPWYANVYYAIRQKYYEVKRFFFGSTWDWWVLYVTRYRRLGRLISLNAPSIVVLCDCKLLLQASRALKFRRQDVNHFPREVVKNVIRNEILDEIRTRKVAQEEADETRQNDDPTR